MGLMPVLIAKQVPRLDRQKIRLLAIEKKFRGARGGQVLSGILALLWQLGVERGYDLAIISGTTRQAKLYQHLGFVPFGPLVGTGEAQFQPMYVTLETFEVTAREFLRSSPARSFQPSAINFLPGPVTVRREVRRAFEQAPESHRADCFRSDFQSTKGLLCELVRANAVICLPKSLERTVVHFAREIVRQALAKTFQERRIGHGCGTHNPRRD